MEQIKYIIKERTDKVVLPKNLGFGQIFTDHIFEMDYEKNKGWHNPTIKPIENLNMHPAVSVIHYGQSIFEGLKAFKTVTDEVVIFRPDVHIQRLNNSAKRICMPEVDVDFALEALKELVAIDSDWIPTNRGEALYIRPFMFGVDPALGVRPSFDYKLIFLLSPVGAYYAEGFKPVKILVQDDYVRAVRKGLGECKTSANYAASLLAAQEASKKGFTQVLWLDGVEQKYLEEVGTMNVFIQFKDEIATPKLSGSILPGVTRRSVIQLLKEWGMNITEREVSIQEVISAYDKGNLVGLFGTGTAAIISPIGWLTYKDKNMTFNNGEPGELDLKLFNEMNAIHRKEKEDTHNWLTKVEKRAVEVE
ncbi:MAG: branched-chain amino acid aminotransferase [Ignavibacteriaceae bacterium]|nr:branched-chain amino acid aminotransferase [Ignavibacterium sp.]MCC6254780.1 branched-chain amino acid aminotransferase [Ignavibacteriaceae bacterium]HRN26303.1 branched-chain amino acid aminotransferase [Ignavibacteriaceae bacterium]HRP93096.1 branched-chain amino acid aminotransferase [Ignavibacteriaceae bacterium]HRQ54694.1 branched-chain amino acid aminotransferase [Ignavibacteriaceae bacterium]